MVYNYWKPISIGIFFAAIISVDGRPAEKRTQNVEPHRSDALQIVEHKSIGGGIGGGSDDDAPIKSLPFYGGAKGDDEDEEDVGMEEEGSDEGESSSSSSSSSTNNSTTSGGGPPEEAVCVGLPPDNASVAEAKPVGLAVAGPGGVAASKPVGTAISGPGGLSVARPVATAIAGVPGAEGLVGLGPAKKRYERPVKVSVPGTGTGAALPLVNRTKEERMLIAKRSSSGDDTEFQYSSSVPAAGRKVYYIPVYLPNDVNVQSEK